MKVKKLKSKRNFKKLVTGDQLLIQRRNGEIVLGTFQKIFVDEDVVFTTPTLPCEDEFNIEMLLSNKSSVIEVFQVLI